jgi:hypothetical protein
MSDRFGTESERLCELIFQVVEIEVLNAAFSKLDNTAFSTKLHP